MNTQTFIISGSAHELFPTETHFGLLSLGKGDMAEIPQQYPFGGPWGSVAVDNISIRESLPMPTSLEMAYLSIIEERFYYLSIPINPNEMLRFFELLSDDSSGKTTPDNLIIGMAPFGGVALWVGSRKKQLLLGWLLANEIEVDMKEFLPQNPELSLKEYCLDYINNDPIVKQNLATNSLPPRDLFDNYMKQFSYRYLPLFEHWDEGEEKWMKYTEEEQEKKPELDYIEEALYDGTHDKLHDGGLLNYHEAGKPKKLCMKWHVKKSEYTAYYWLDDQMIRAVFDKFYGTHPDTKTDFIIHVDTIKNKYQLALYRYGLKEPVLIPEDAYQLIVFKNMFEYFRSENYDQPKGAWIW